MGTNATGNLKWFKDGKELVGQTNAWLNLPNLQVLGSGVYQCYNWDRTLSRYKDKDDGRRFYS